MGVLSLSIPLVFGLLWLYNIFTTKKRTHVRTDKGDCTMKWIFEHLPDECLRVTSEKPDVEVRVNSKFCSQQKSRPCKNAGRCCLGVNVDCSVNKCPNTLIVRDIKTLEKPLRAGSG